MALFDFKIMSGKQGKQSRKGSGKPKDNHQRPTRRQSNDTPKPEPESQRPVIERRRRDPAPEPTPAPAPAPAPTTTTAQQFGIQVVKREKGDLKILFCPAVQESIEARKKAHTYSVEHLKAMKHARELTNPQIFQYHAELQLYKRYLAGSRQRQQKIYVQASDMSVLQHRINSILLQLTVDRFQQVFTEILSLGVESDVFVLSFVNVVYKQAVLNPTLAVLFAMLSANIMYVIKHTKYADKMKELFLERCNESFVVPKPDTDMGVLILLRGIVIFAGHLLREKIIPKKVLSEWSGKLLQSGITSSLGLLINLLLAGGVQFAKDHKKIFAQISEKVKDGMDDELVGPYKSLDELINGSVEPQEHREVELKKPELKRSPSVDKELDDKYGSLFKKSDSIPMELSQLAECIDEDESMDSLVTQYFYSTDLQEFFEGLERLQYTKNDERIASDLVRAIVEAPEANLLVIASLVVDLLRNGYYGDEELKAAIKNVAGEVAPILEKANKMIVVYAQLLNSEICTLDEFEALYSPMKEFWPSMIQTLFIQLDRIKGDWLDDFLDSEYWREARFTGAESIVDRIATLQKWELLDFLPQYSIAATFMDSAKTGFNFAVVTSEDLAVDKQEIAPIIFEIIATFSEAQMKSAADKLKGWFKSCSGMIPELAAKCGPGGTALAALLQ